MPGTSTRRSSKGTGAGRSELNPESAWAAVLERDAAADGLFVYAVSTTGIYCRPVCPARRPRRERVSFYGTAGEAESAGYRACRRCRPDRPTTLPAGQCIERARAYLDAHLDETVTLEALARVAYMSPFHLQRTFKRMLGCSPREYVRARRSDRLKARLRAGESVGRAIYEAGFGSGSRVYERSNREMGMTPAMYRDGGSGARIRYTIVPCRLGRLLVGATERGVCAVALGDGETELEAELRREFPGAHVERSDAIGEIVKPIAALADGEPAGIDVPLDMRATAFQQRVWNALREIPRGETRTYAELAASIGAPTAVRAVASACARNRIALAIPCHRVVRSDGGLGGYRWGEERKRELLVRESAKPE